MKTLPKEHVEQYEAVVTDLLEEQGTLETAIAHYNQTVATAMEELLSAVADYNLKIRYVNDVRETIASDIRNYYDEKSEKWQESEKGQAYYAWAEAWDEPLDEMDEPTFEEVEEPDFHGEESIDMISPVEPVL